MNHHLLNRFALLVGAALLSTPIAFGWYPKESYNFVSAYSRGEDVATSNPTDPTFPYTLVAVPIMQGIRPFLVNDRGTVVFHFGDPGSLNGYGRQRFGEFFEPFLSDRTVLKSLNNNDVVAGFFRRSNGYTDAVVWPADGLFSRVLFTNELVGEGGFQSSMAYSIDYANRVLCTREYEIQINPSFTIEYFSDEGYAEQDYREEHEDTLWTDLNGDGFTLASSWRMIRQHARARWQATYYYDEETGEQVRGPDELKMWLSYPQLWDPAGGVIYPLCAAPDGAIFGYSYGCEEWPFKGYQLFAPDGRVMDYPLIPYIECEMNNRGQVLSMHFTGQRYWEYEYPLALWDAYAGGAIHDIGTSENVWQPNLAEMPLSANIGISNPSRPDEPLLMINGPHLCMEIPVDLRVDKMFTTYDFEDLLAGGPWSNFTATAISPSGEFIAGVALDERGFSHGVLLLRAALLTDFNRDRTIDAQDRVLIRDGRFNRLRNPWRFWANLDDDDGDEARSSKDDLPRAFDDPGALAGADAMNNRIDGVRDLVDFFPVMLEWDQFRDSVAEPDKLGLRMRHTGDALNFVYTDFDGRTVGAYLTETEIPTLGPNGDETVARTTVVPLGAEWIDLDEAWVKRCIERGSAVWLFEARAPTSEPLEVQITYRGKELATLALALSISPISDMYRWLNVRECVGGEVDEPSRMGDPPNFPRRERKRHHLVSLHGYNATENDARSHHSEMFKRLFWSGFNGNYVGVAWHGEESHISLLDFTPDYYENVTNAFKSARPLVDALQAHLGTIDSIMAHSLGNVVVNSALVDCGLKVGRYFALNAAVPLEAFNAADLSIDLMRHYSWKDYEQRLWAPFWHELFAGTDDPRAALTWKGRFADAVGVLYNFYSSGEDVLANADGSTPTVFGPVIDALYDRKGVGIWYTQEMWKGTTLASMMADDGHGGWGFDKTHWFNLEHKHRKPIEREKLWPSEANETRVPTAALVSEPFFGRFQTSDDDAYVEYDGSGLLNTLGNGSLGATEQQQFDTRAKLLAEAIPALSLAVGSNALGVEGARNFDMNSSKFRSELEWPSGRSGSDWRHSDLLRPAYAHNHALYDEIVTQGDMK